MTLIKAIFKRIQKYYMDSYTKYFLLEVASSKMKDTVYTFVLDHLNCVDSKSASLLTYNALSVAMSTFLLNLLSDTIKLYGTIEIFVKISICLLLVSSFLCLLCIDIFSPHILTENMNAKEYIEKVKHIVLRRTMFYRLALRITQINAIFLLIVFIVFIFNN